MEHYIIFSRLLALYEKTIVDDEFRDDLLMALQEGIKNNKINKENLPQIEQMKADEVIDYVNDQLRLF